MVRDLSRLASAEHDLLVVGGGIHGLAAAYDAADRGLSVALVERDDFGSGASFNHLKTIHGGLRYLQSADVRRVRQSIAERRALARIAPHLLEPLPFLISTYGLLTRSRLAMRVAFELDAAIGRRRNDGVVPALRLPRGRVISLADCPPAFRQVQRDRATGAARWYDYQVRNTDRLTLAFAFAADRAGAAMANYVEAVGPLQEGPRVNGMQVRDALTGERFDVRARVTLNAAGAGVVPLMEQLGLDPGVPLLKAMNVVTSRRYDGPGIGGWTREGRMLCLVSWAGRAVFGTSHGDRTCGPGDTAVSDDEVQAFVAEVNDAFNGYGLRRDEVTLVHRGVVPAARRKNGTLTLATHSEVRDHRRDSLQGVVSVVGVKYTTGRGVAQRAVDIVCAQLDRGKGECRTATRLLPGAVEDPEALVSDAGRVWTGRIAPDAVRQVVATCGAHYEQVLRRTEDCPELSQTIAQSSVVRAQVVHAVREEMACRLIDVIARRTPLGSAAYPGDEAVEACAALMRDELCWSDTRVAEEIAATRAFYLPVRIA